MESCCLCFFSLGLAGCNTTHLHLGEEEVTTTNKNFCSTSTARMPYAQLGSVDVETLCCGNCFSVGTNGGTIMPGFGCGKQEVDGIAEELQKRKVTRGNIAQVQMQENLMIEIIKLSVQMDQLAKKEGVKYPPTQQTMEEVFGQGVQAPLGWNLPITALPQGDGSGALQVMFPPGVSPGQSVLVQGPNGIFSVQAPMEVTPGMVIMVQPPPPPMPGTPTV
ncbi:unnamed protein product [Effrenium voratum]|uniref:Uncharacterized protein n=1 Tax=Effrenium voratum TaxID=2562239 RepID=A0AA36J7A9_9DINO|nr:unnamed protein product [Effrenium voratum]